MSIIGIIDGGFAVNEKRNVGVIIFRISENESEPIEHLGYCNPWDKDTIINHLKKLYFPTREASISPAPNIHKENPVSAATYKLRAESLVDVFLFLENIRSQIKYFVVNSIPGHPHVEVTFDTNLPFDEIKRELESIYNAHVMVDTIQPIEK